MNESPGPRLLHGLERREHLYLRPRFRPHDLDLRLPGRHLLWSRPGMHRALTTVGSRPRARSAS